MEGGRRRRDRSPDSRAFNPCVKTAGHAVVWDPTNINILISSTFGSSVVDRIFTSSIA